jgi:hypothetical protein
MEESKSQSNVFDQIIQFANLSKTTAQALKNCGMNEIEANDKQLKVFFEHVKILVGDQKIKDYLGVASNDVSSAKVHIQP